jgi:cytochrome c oxidase cbb3-type subunit 3
MKITNILSLILILNLSILSSFSQIRNAPLTNRDIDLAVQNYQRYCALCHGVDREGNAADFAPSLRSRSLMSTISLNFLASSIAFGRPNTAMAAYLNDNGGPLSMKEIFNMASWLKHESGHETIAITDEQITGNLDNGLNIYAKECFECHGKKGEGVTAPAIANPAFLAFATDAFIKYAIVNGRDETKMPAFENKLTDDQINDLTAYIRSLTSGWSLEPKELAPYPKPENYVLNPKGKNAKFDLREERYVPMEQVLEALNSKKRLVILDTRTASEWHNAHIPGAVPMPYYISEEDVDKDLPKDKTWIIAYCSCPHAASDKIINMLRKKGYKNTAVIDEGFFSWINENYPISAGKTKSSELK